MQMWVHMCVYEVISCVHVQRVCVHTYTLLWLIWQSHLSTWFFLNYHYRQLIISPCSLIFFFSLLSDSQQGNNKPQHTNAKQLREIKKKQAVQVCNRNLFIFSLCSRFTLCTYLLTHSSNVCYQLFKGGLLPYLPMVAYLFLSGNVNRHFPRFLFVITFMFFFHNITASKLERKASIWHSVVDMCCKASHVPTEEVLTHVQVKVYLPLLQVESLQRPVIPIMRTSHLLISDATDLDTLNMWFVHISSPTIFKRAVREKLHLVMYLALPQQNLIAKDTSLT